MYILTYPKALIIQNRVFLNNRQNFSSHLKLVISQNTVRTPIVDPFPIEDPSLKIQIEDPFLFSKKWVLGVLYQKKFDQKIPLKVLQENSSPVHYWCAYGKSFFFKLLRKPFLKGIHVFCTIVYFSNFLFKNSFFCNNFL